MAISQIFVRLLDGSCANLRLSSPTISVKSLKQILYKSTQIPPQHQRLITGTRQLREDSLIEASADGFFPTIHLLLRLRGGKGGFGSLLRGAATKAGQKKTNNFDACRDMSGRRLRHVNAERKLEEWKAETEERRLEKIAEDFIKKKAKEVKKSGSSGDSDKYVQKYREDSRKCMEEVEASVREAFCLFQNSKRKIMPASGSSSKRLKMLMMEEEKSDGSDSDDDEEEAKSVVLDDGGHSLENKVGEGCSTSFSGGQSDGESSGGGTAQSNLEEENQGDFKSGEVSGDGTNDAKVNSSSEISTEEDSISEEREVSETEVALCEDDILPQPESISSLLVGQGSGSIAIHAEEKGSGELKSAAAEQMVVVSNENNAALAKPLDFDEFSSAANMEVLGMEILKTELQARGLKCGGTLQERAGRLFLLKTTPVEMLPKKLLAKK